MKRRERSNSILFVVFFPCVGRLLDEWMNGWIFSLFLVING